LKKNVLQLLLLLSFITTKASIQNVILNDSTYAFIDSVCNKYYYNKDSINISPKQFIRFKQQLNVDDNSLMEMVSFLINLNREKQLNTSKQELENASVLANKLIDAFEPELLKIFKNNKLKQYALLKENLTNLYIVLLFKNKVAHYTNEQLLALNAGDIERLLNKNIDAALMQQYINFVLNNSNYKLIK